MRAQACYQHGQFNEALEFVDALLTEDGDLAAARDWRASILSALGRLESAIEELKLVLYHDPNDLEAFRDRTAVELQLALTGDERYLQPALRHAQYVIEMYSTDPIAPCYRGIIAICRQEYDRAIDELTVATDEFSKRGASEDVYTSMVCRGFARMKKAEYKRAKSDFDDLLERYPSGREDATLRSLRGECLAGLGDLKRSIADFTEAIKRRPNDVNLHARRAASYVRMRDLNSALTDLDQIVRISPAEPRTYFDRLSVRIANHDDVGAMADIDRIIQLVPGTAGPYLHRAVQYVLLLNDRDRALEDVDRALSIDAMSPFSYALRGCLLARKSEYIPAMRDMVLFICTLEFEKVVELLVTQLDRSLPVPSVTYKSRGGAFTNESGQAVARRCATAAVVYLAHAASRLAESK